MFLVELEGFLRALWGSVEHSVPTTALGISSLNDDRRAVLSARAKKSKDQSCSSSPGLFFFFLIPGFDSASCVTWPSHVSSVDLSPLTCDVSLSDHMPHCPR